MPRSFYSDDEEVLPTPGRNEPIDPKLENSESPNLHNLTFLHGMAIRTSPLLEKYSSKARQLLLEKYTLIDAELATQKSALNNEWSITKEKYNSIVVEPLLPSVIGILTTVLATGVAVSKRGIVVRTFIPAFAGVFVYRQTMPLSYQNSVKFLVEQEARVPEFHEARIEAVNQLHSLQADVSKATAEGNAALTRQIHSLRASIKELFK
ncbi:BA75_02244T0 [Komagataella pastoris]|uniref:MICOS complex subunit n=1 Tax=Komagataella pastoris TaxID=4922 RepID=A0A1B2JB42_PICPA|nr:BA75_02244T0 [Komagataella pastoris]